MKKLVMSFLIVYLLGFSLFAQSTEWTIDKPHTNIGFTITHLVISDVTGRFKDFDGTIKTSGEEFEGANIEIVIQTASIFTDHEKRDKHLRSDDFFSAEKNPQKYEIKGDLNMNGVTREVVLDGTFKGVVKDPWGGTRAGFKASTTIDRYDYNLTYNTALETGGFLIGKEVEININIELIQKK
jgi:polyisoprenoid-binding protein YceI